MSDSIWSLSGTRRWTTDVRVKVTVDTLQTADPLIWLNQTVFPEGVLLLAHAVDGVNWGWSTGSGFLFSHDVAPKLAPVLHPETLQQLRVFTNAWECFFWYDGQGWRQRLIEDDADGTVLSVIDEYHLLWGTQTEVRAQGFSVLADGAQGLRHVLPFATPDTLLTKRAALSVRHYVGEHANGSQFIALSRLSHVEVLDYE